MWHAFKRLFHWNKKIDMYDANSEMRKNSTQSANKNDSSASRRLYDKSWSKRVSVSPLYTSTRIAHSPQPSSAAVREHSERKHDDEVAVNYEVYLEPRSIPTPLPLPQQEPKKEITIRRAEITPTQQPSQKDTSV